MQLPIFSIVVPCYNEQDIFSLCINEMISEGKISQDSNMVFIDYGS